MKGLSLDLRRGQPVESEAVLGACIIKGSSLLLLHFHVVSFNWFFGVYIYVMASVVYFLPTSCTNSMLPSQLSRLVKRSHSLKYKRKNTK